MKKPGPGRGKGPRRPPFERPDERTGPRRPAFGKPDDQKGPPRRPAFAKGARGPARGSAPRPGPPAARPSRPPQAAVETPIPPRPTPRPAVAPDVGPLLYPHAPIRFPAALAVGQAIQLDPGVMEALRFRQVNVKEAFTLQDSEGAFFRASLRGADAEGGEAQVYEQMPWSPESPAQITLCCAVLARQRMIFVSQKATELGILRLQPLLTGRSVPPEGLEHEKAHAWPGQAIRAAKQCRRASVPEVRESLPFAEVLASELWRGPEARFFLDDRATEGARLERGPASIALAVGPEGGWTDDEREQLAATGGAPLVLGGRVLRAETAVVAGLVLVQHHLGDLLP